MNELHNNVGSPFMATASTPTAENHIIPSVGSPFMATSSTPAPIDTVAMNGDPTNNASSTPAPNDAVAINGDPTNNAASTPAPNDAVAINGDPTNNTTSIRKYPRANFHDYNGGTYFVTVCTKNKTHYFGEINNDEMHLSPIGTEMDSQLRNISSHYEDVEIPLHVVMPNHFHAIIIVGSPLVATEATESHNLGRLNQLARLTVATSGDPTLVTHHGCRLGNIIAAIKAAVTRFAHRSNIEFGWQSRYHDHIIRETHDGNRIAEYIENNVARWANDCFYE